MVICITYIPNIFLLLGDVVAIDEPYICGPISQHTEVCHYNGCLKLDVALFPCPKCYLVCLFLTQVIILGRYLYIIYINIYTTLFLSCY